MSKQNRNRVDELGCDALLDADWRPTLIRAERFDEEGIRPSEKNLCHYALENSGCVACVSGTASSICGGYEGLTETCGELFVICGEDLPASNAEVTHRAARG